MLRNIFLFTETLTSRIYHIQTIYIYALLASFIPTTIFVFKGIYKKFKVGYKQGFREIRDIYKYMIIGGLIVFFARSVTHISYYMGYIDQDALITPTQVTAPLHDYIEDEVEYYGWEINELYDDAQIKERIQYINGLFALYVTILMTLGGMTITFSYGNKMLRNIGIFLIYISLGIYIIFLLFQHREHDLFTKEIPLETNPF